MTDDVEYPVTLEQLDDRRLRIVWSDDWEQILDPRVLRRNCPCATCREKQKADEIAAANRTAGELPVLNASSSLPLAVTRMRPSGNYAYNIQFNDGHTTGVYTLELLRSLGE